MRISSFNISNKSNESDSKTSPWITRYEAVVYWLNLWLVDYKDLRWYFLELEAFNFYTTQSVQKTNVFSLYGRLFDWELRPKKTRQTN